MLFLLLIVFALKQQLDEQQFLQLVTFERSKILQSMGLVGSKSAVKLLARTAPKIYGQIAVQSIVQALKDPVQIEKLQHITHLTSLSFIMLNKGQNWIWAGLIQLLKPEDTVNQAT